MINTFVYLAACLSRHHDKYDPNQFKTSLQKFFIESGDKNGGTEKRKRKINEKKLEGQIKQKNLSKNSASDIFESSEEDVESSGNEAANFRKHKKKILIGLVRSLVQVHQIQIIDFYVQHCRET
jgi:hypothetical protein